MNYAPVNFTLHHRIFFLLMKFDRYSTLINYRRSRDKIILLWDSGPVDKIYWDHITRPIFIILPPPFLLIFCDNISVCLHIAGAPIEPRSPDEEPSQTSLDTKSQDTAQVCMCY